MTVGRLAFLAIIVTSVALPSAVKASVPPAHGISVAAAAHGLKVTLSVPRRSYPRDALVRAELTIRNVSSHVLYDDESNGDAVAVLNGRGGAVYQAKQPLGAATLINPKGPFRWRKIAVGRAFTDHIYLVMRGRFIMAETSVGRSLSGGWDAVHTPRARLQLTNEAVPETTIAVSPGLSVTVTSPWPVSGELHYLWQSSCSTPDGTGSTGRGWTSTTARSIKPVFAGEPTPTSGCAGSVVWNGIVGWLNHPVSTFSYRTPSSTS